MNLKQEVDVVSKFIQSYEITDKGKQLLFIICIAGGAFMANLDITIVNTSLPSIARDLATTPNMIALTVLVYQMFEAGFLLLFGKMGDMKGFRKIFISGFIFFTLGSLFCGLSSGFDTLFISRAIQGLGGAMLFSVMMATVSSFLPADSRGKGIGIVTVAAAAGVALGPLIGGYITTTFNWRWIFFVNVPVGIVAIILGWIIIPSKQQKSRDKKLDLTGAITSFLALSLFVYAVHAEHRLGWQSPVIIGSMVLAVLFAIIFAINEKRAQYPLLHSELFTNKNYTLSALALIPSFMTLAGILFVFPFFLELTKGMSAKTAGLLLMALAAGQLTSPYVGHLADRFGARKILLIGMICAVIAFVWFLFIGENTGTSVIVGSLLLFGLVMGLEKAPNVQLALSFVPPEQKGIGASALGVFRSLGILLGILAFEKIFTKTMHAVELMEPDKMTLTVIEPGMVAHGFHATMLFGLFLSILAMAMILMVRESQIKK